MKLSIEDLALVAAGMTDAQAEAAKQRAIAFSRGGKPGPCGACLTEFTSWKAKREHLRAAACVRAKP